MGSQSSKPTTTSKADTKPPTNWIDLPMEMRAECIKSMDFKTRMRLRATSHTEKSLVESAPKFFFFSAHIKSEFNFAPHVVCMSADSKREFVSENKASPSINFLHTSGYQLMLQVFKYASVYTMQIDAKFVNDDEANQFISDISSSAPIDVVCLDLTIINPKVAQFLVRNTIFRNLTVGKPKRDIGKFFLQDFRDIPAIFNCAYLTMKDEQTPDDVFLLIEKWIENDSETHCIFECSINGDWFVEFLAEKLENRIISETIHSEEHIEFLIRTDNESKHIVVDAWIMNDWSRDVTTDISCNIINV